MATNAHPAAGTRFRKTTETEILPPRGTSPDDAKPTPFYDRDLETVVTALTPDDWSRHIMRVYRSNEKWERGAGPVDNVFNGPFTEDDIRARFGGGRYMLWLYGPPKKQTLVGRYQVELEGPPVMNSVPRNGNGQLSSGDSIALEAMRMASNPEFARFQMESMKAAVVTAIELVKSQIPAAQNPLETLRAAKEILGVGGQQNSLLDTIRVLKEIGIIGSPQTKGIEDVLQMITTLKTSGLISSGVPKADPLSTFAANMPMLADRIVTGFHELRLRAEADERTTRMQHGQMRPNDPGVITLDGQPPAPAPEPGAPAAAAAATDPPGTITEKQAQAIITQYNLARLVAGIKQPDATGQDMYGFLLNAWPEVLDELVKLDKNTLLAFFKSREMQIQQLGFDTLAEVGDDPRLPKMIEEFLKIAKEEAASEKVSTVAVV